MRCNLHCKHCGSDCKTEALAPDMPVEDFLKVIDQQVTPHVDTHETMIISPGGEPLARKDIEDIGVELYKREYPWGMVTNGMMFTEERFKRLCAAVSVAAALFAMHRRHTGVPLQKSDFKPRRPVMGQILRIGVPVALQDGLIQIAFILITIIANRRGLIDAAAVGIVEKIICFLFLVPSSMLSTVSALGAQNIGAGREDRARQTLRYAIYIAAGFGLVCGIFMQFFSGQVVALFTDPADPAGAEAVRLGGEYLRGYIWDCLFAGIHFSFSGYFCACGRSGLSFLHNILAIVLVRVPGAYLTSIFFPDTLYPMGLSTSAASLVSVIICVVAYFIITRRPRAAQKGGLHGT